MTHMHLGEGDIYNVKSETDLDLIRWEYYTSCIREQASVREDKPKFYFTTGIFKNHRVELAPISNVVLCRRSISLESAIKIYPSIASKL